MKILVAGAWHSSLHESAVAGALESLGHSVVAFAWQKYFAPPDKWLGGFRHGWGRAQDKFAIGPAVARLNRDFLRIAQEAKPDAVFVYRGTHIRPGSLVRLKRMLPKCVLVGYNNDDPFGPGQPKWFWRHFLTSLPHYDLVLAYRQHNIDDFRRMGARDVRLLRSWYMPDRNRPLVLTDDEKQQFGCDVVFVGHYEPDDRVRCLETIVKQGWRLRLFGPGYEWDPVLRDNPVLRHLAPVRLVWEDDYTRAIAGASIALCFLSKLNRDTYTRRCFEIPAIGTLLLSERTDDLRSLFREGHEADFFAGPEEMRDKVAFYLQNQAARDQVAKAGHQRVRIDGHDVVSRMQLVTGWIGEIMRSSH
jgi:spore maturation protein CgeB